MTKKKRDEILKEFKEEGIVINGCLIKDDTVYTVVQKKPTNAPPVYRLELESEKERIPGVANVKVFPTVGGLIDNGFHPNSDVFNRNRVKDYSEREELSEKYKAIFLEPLKAIVSKEDLESFEDPRAYELYEGKVGSDGYEFTYEDLVTCKLYEGRQFNTARPIQRFQLYVAIISDGLVEKGQRSAEETKAGQRSETNFHQAQYAYESKAKVKTNRERAIINAGKSSRYMTELLNEDRDLLIDIINFNFPSSLNKKDSDETLYLLFDKIITSHVESKARTERFLRAVEDYKKDPKTVKNTLEVYGKLLDNKQIFQNPKKEIVVGEKVFRNSKEAAKVISSNSDLYSKFYEIIS